MKQFSPRGFTLIELLVVIAIIGLLATFAVVQLGASREKARDTKRRTDLRMMQKAIELYYDENGSYPNTSGAWWGVAAPYGSHGTTGATGYIPNLAPKYIGVLPLDPRPMAHPDLYAGCVLAESNYVYISNGTTYKLLAHCSIEAGSISPTDPMRDTNRSYALMVCDQGGVACAW